MDEKGMAVSGLIDLGQTRPTGNSQRAERRCRLKESSNSFYTLKFRECNQPSPLSRVERKRVTDNQFQ